MRSPYINFLSRSGIALVILLVISACNPSQPSPDLAAESVWFSVDGSVNYKIEAGDTLISISDKVNVSLLTLLVLNQFYTNTVIYPDQSLLIGKVDPQIVATYLPASPSEYGEGQDFIEIERVEINITEGDLKPLISLDIYGQFVDNCIEIVAHRDTIIQDQSEHTFYFGINPVRLDDVPCDGQNRDFLHTFSLSYEYLHAGKYAVEVNGYRTSFTLEEAAANYPRGINPVSNLVWDQLSEKFNAIAEFIRIEYVIWSNNCLDLGEEDEDCVEVDTPGYYLVAVDAARIWVYHTDADGSEIRGYETDDHSLLELPRGMPVMVTSQYRAVVQVRSGPGNNYPIVGRIENGGIVEAIGVSTNGSWLQIVLPGFGGNYIAWLNRQLTDFTEIVALPVVDPPPTPAPD